MNKFIPVTKPLIESEKEFIYIYAEELNAKKINCCLKKNKNGNYVLWRELSDEDLLDKFFMFFNKRETNKEGSVMKNLNELRPNKRFFIKEK